ncbi:MAG: transposase [Trebonia sp.]
MRERSLVVDADKAGKGRDILIETTEVADLGEIVLSDDKPAKLPAEAVSEGVLDRMVADVKRTGVSLLDGAEDPAPRLIARMIERALDAGAEDRGTHQGGGTARLLAPSPDIWGRLERAYGASVPRTLAAGVADTATSEIIGWQANRLRECRAIGHFDVLAILRSGGVAQDRVAYLAAVMDTDGSRYVLGIWLGGSDEGSSFWAELLGELRDRRVREVRLVCSDGLSGRGWATATWRDGR